MLMTLTHLVTAQESTPLHLSTHQESTDDISFLCVVFPSMLWVLLIRKKCTYVHSCYCCYCCYLLISVCLCVFCCTVCLTYLFVWEFILLFFLYFIHRPAGLHYTTSPPPTTPTHPLQHLFIYYLFLRFSLFVSLCLTPPNDQDSASPLLQHSPLHLSTANDIL